MAKKRSILTTFVATLLIIVIMLALTPLPAYATTLDSETQISMGIVSTELLNVRDRPSTSSYYVIGLLKKGTIVTIYETVNVPNTYYNDWLKIDYYGETAYVAQKYIDYVDICENDDNSNSIVEVENCRGMTTASTLNLRAKPTTNSEKLTSLDKYTYIDILEFVYTSDTTNRIWLKVQYDDFTGYVAKQYVKVINNSPINVSDELGVITDLIRLRTNPTTASTIKDRIEKNTCVEVLDSCITCDKFGKWYKVQTPNGNIGWIAGEYLHIGKWTLSSTVRTWTSSDRNRNHNIALACSYINGQIITPGNSFSWFESVLGSCSAEKGFLPATIYLNGAHEQGAGGGVCQVSTTINMAIKQLGIPTNAHQHSLPVLYAKKEDEATVSYPNHNFSFENTLQTPIMLEMIATSASCTCNVYVLE